VLHDPRLKWNAIRAVLPISKDCSLYPAVSIFRSMSGTPPQSFTHHHPSPFPMSEEWTSHYSYYHCQTTPSCFLWLPDSAPLLYSGHARAHKYTLFLSSICFILEIGAARSSETLVLQNYMASQLRKPPFESSLP
jgi:hypothetical protein